MSQSEELQTNVQVLSSQMDLVITTCLFLASKLEEDQRRLRDVINVTHRLTSSHQPRASLKRSREVCGLVWLFNFGGAAPHHAASNQNVRNWNDHATVQTVLRTSR